MVHRGVFPIMLVSIVLCSGCADPPVEEMMQAETAIQIAQAAGANEYASADFRAAAAALADAKSRTERKDYEGARASALDALQKSEAAKNNVEVGKRGMKEVLDRALIALQDEWTQFGQKLNKRSLAKAQQTALEEARSIFDEGIENINGHTEAGDYAGALSLVKQVQGNMTKIKETINIE